MTAQQLQTLARLLEASRAGALFVEVPKLLAWLELTARPLKEQEPKHRMDARNGFPSRASLERLWAMQKLAREFLQTHGAKGAKDSSSFSLALAETELPPAQQVDVKLVARSGTEGRFLVAHDTWESKSGQWVRTSVLFSQTGLGPFRVGKSEQAMISEAFARELMAACEEGCLKAAQLLSGPTLRVHELTRGTLGPCWWKLNAPAPLQPFIGDGAVLSLLLERTGEGVQPRSADPFEPKSPNSARERRFVCTRELEAPLKAWVKSTGVSAVVRGVS